MESVKIEIPSDPKYLKIVRCGIGHLCKVSGFPKETRHEITLAVDEAVSNIIKHAYERKYNKPIIVNCKLLDDRIEIVLRDFGLKANLKKIKSRDLKEVKPGGLGVHIIQSIMDVVIYDNTIENGNQLILAKYLPGKEKNNAKN